MSSAKSSKSKCARDEKRTDAEQFNLWALPLRRLDAADITRATMEAIGFYNELGDFEALIAVLHDRYEVTAQTQKVS